MTTRGADMGFCSTPSVAQDAADAVRGSAAVALARSPHPKAKALLMTMHGDPYDGVRLTVIHALEGMDSTESLDLLRQMTHDGEKEVSDEAKHCLAQREMRSALTPALSPFAAKLVAAMPAGWKLTAHGTCGTPHRWTGAVTGEFLSFKHEGLRAVFPPGPASFTVSVIRSDYAGRLPKSDTTQPGGAYLEWVSPERLLFIEGSALQGEGQIALEKAFRSLGFDRASRADITPAAAMGRPATGKDGAYNYDTDDDQAFRKKVLALFQDIQKGDLAAVKKAVQADPKLLTERCPNSNDAYGILGIWASPSQRWQLEITEHGGTALHAGAVCHQEAILRYLLEMRR